MGEWLRHSLWRGSTEIVSPLEAENAFSKNDLQDENNINGFLEDLHKAKELPGKTEDPNKDEDKLGSCQDIKDLNTCTGSCAPKIKNGKQVCGRGKADGCSNKLANECNGTTPWGGTCKLDSKFNLCYEQKPSNCGNIPLTQCNGACEVQEGACVAVAGNTCSGKSANTCASGDRCVLDNRFASGGKCYWQKYQNCAGITNEGACVDSCEWNGTCARRENPHKLGTTACSAKSKAQCIAADAAEYCKLDKRFLPEAQCFFDKAALKNSILTRIAEVGENCYITGAGYEFFTDLIAHRGAQDHRTTVLHLPNGVNSENFVKAIEEKCLELQVSPGQNRESLVTRISNTINQHQEEGIIIYNDVGKDNIFQSYLAKTTGADKYKAVNYVGYRYEDADDLGFGIDAIDHGGVKRDFLNRVSKELSQFFIVKDGKASINSAFNQYEKCTIMGNPQSAEQCWKNLGLVFAKLAFIEKSGVPHVQLHPLLLKRLGGAEPTLVDILAALRLLDKTHFLWLMKVLETNQLNRDANYSQFMRPEFDFGWQDGDAPPDEVDFTNSDNVFKYVRELAKHHFMGKEELIEKFVEGFQSVTTFHGDNILLPADLKPTTLALLLEGNPSGIEDVKDAIDAMEMTGFGDAETNIRKWFKEAVVELVQAKKISIPKLMHFWTGFSTLSFNTLKMKKLEDTHAAAGARALMRSHTCSFELEFPVYPDKETLKKRLETSVKFGDV